MTHPEALRIADMLEAGNNGYPSRAAAELRRLHAENEALRVDAERYRYLRNRNRQEVLNLTGPAAGVWIDCDDENGDLIFLTGDDADAAIDAERGKV